MNMITKLLAVLGAAMMASPALAQEAAASLDQRVNDAFASSTGWFVSFIFAPIPGTAFPWIVMWLVIGASVFTIYFAFVQFRFFGHAISLVKGDYSDPNDAGEVSHFQALATALSGTVGLGNIAGVAVAVGIGGPGATFWMILAGLLGMASKFTECTLGVKYRNEYPDGSVSGGPMYYMSKGFDELGLPGGKILAILFSIFCILGAFGGGNMFQANQAHVAISGLTDQIGLTEDGFSGLITGFAFAIVVFAVIVGGVKSIAKVTEKIVPFMGIMYVGAALIVLIVNFNMIGWAFGQIFAGAFTGLGVTGGIVGALIQGFKRAAFSNEAGVGSAAIAHSAVKTKEPITEGFVSLLEPLIDTVVICTMTALVIVISQQLIIDANTGNYVLYTVEQAQQVAVGLELPSGVQAAIATAADGGAIKEALEGIDGDLAAPVLTIVNNLDSIRSVEDARGVALTAAAFGSAISWFPFVLAIAVVLFAFSTMISWSYYGLKAWTYLFGEGQTAELVFKIIFCIFIVIGAAASLGPVIDFSDAAIFAMAVVNITALYFLMKVVRDELASYSDRLKSGVIKKFEH